MAQIDVVDGLPRDHEEDEADVDPGNKGMGKVTVFVLDIGETQDVELLLATTASGIDGEQDGPGEAAANEADDD